MAAAAIFAGACASNERAAETQAPPETKQAAPKPILFQGTGDYRRADVDAKNGAREYVDQGLVFLFGFNHAEAIESFEEATRRDPMCAFAWWGLAYACGPHINNGEVGPAMAKLADETIPKAMKAAEKASAPVAAPTPAFPKRPATPNPTDRSAVNLAFAEAMRDVWKAHPNDAEVGYVFAEAMMNLRPWDLWTKDGKPQPGTEEVVATLERVMELSPRHPGASHLYIHAVEASPTPDRAIVAADRLRTLVPAVGHLVHMPSHIDIRVGRYAEAVETNARAVEADRAYLTKRDPGGMLDLYRAHNHHFLVWAAMFDGRKKTALEAADALARELSPESIRKMPAYLEAFGATKLHVLVRFGMWEEALKVPEGRSDDATSEAMRRYARGVALAALGRAAEAAAEIPAFEAAVARIPETYYVGNNTTRAVMDVGRHVLLGEVAFRSGRIDEGLALLKKAAELDDALKYDEPWGWPTPPRHALGALLLESRRAEEALATYEADLVRYRENGWALHGLAESLARLGRSDEALEVDARFKKAWARADVRLAASCFCRRG
jgi:tetratricopeptide (TPR) repeat protein